MPKNREKGVKRGLKRRELGVKACPTGRKLPPKRAKRIKKQKSGLKRALFPPPRLCAVGRVHPHTPTQRTELFSSLKMAFFSAEMAILGANSALLGAKLAFSRPKWHF